MNKAKIIFLIAILIGLTSCKSDKKPLTLATYTYATNNRIDNLKPLSVELENLLNQPVDVKSYPDVTSFIEGIKSDEVDIALINTLGYLLLSLDNKNMEPIVTLKVKQDAVDNYKTVLLTNSDNITDLNGLKEHADSLSMMFVTEGSTSGNLVPRLLLSSIGIKSPTKQFKEVSYGGNHTSTFNKLTAGEADICAIGSNEYFKQIQADSTLLNKTRLLWISKEIPLGPVLINNKLTEADREKISDLFLSLHEKNPEALQSIKDGWSEAKQAEKFYPITDSYYDNFRRLNGNNTDLSDILNMFVK
ncbi:PhnD/SsuA/transferrin family substrate-binding protein [Leptobacterium flavescens]|uniref:PhnD/SsuA/transferrin family substrate-binding protein n=1 Tax=Leptobacterium flavescens TaxID=472055 RepID=A0A6P0UNU7_9FLAO|nr:PhnD/SsuA/transferrin family substrate-binding protein [Leptobacterium flavescens]NER15051.1 PhnD/SsuA/transferrin family substrate-binding protein [Leptobacterium flavescens]